MPDPTEELITILMAITRDPSLALPSGRLRPLCWWSARIRNDGSGGGDLRPPPAPHWLARKPLRRRWSWAKDRNGNGGQRA
jgi:hypothetical protein